MSRPLLQGCRSCARGPWTSRLFSLVRQSRHAAPFATATLDAADDASSVQTWSGRLRKILHYTDSSDFVVALFDRDNAQNKTDSKSNKNDDKDHDSVIKIVGPLPGAPIYQANQTPLRITARHQENDKYGPQWDIVSCTAASYQSLDPQSVALAAFLQTHATGLGPALVQRVAAALATEKSMHTVEDLHHTVTAGGQTIDNNKHNFLDNIEGIGAQKSRAIRQALQDWDQPESELRAWVDLAERLQEAQIYDPETLGRICSKLMTALDAEQRESLLEDIVENPYSLLRTRGFSFDQADRIADSLGFSSTSPVRIATAVYLQLYKDFRRGDTATKMSKVIRATLEVLNKSPAVFPDHKPVESLHVIPELRSHNGDRFVRRIVQHTESDNTSSYVLLKNHDDQEKSLYSSIQRILDGESCTIHCQDDITMADLGSAYSDEQRKAIKLALTHKISIITGGPGTGKSWVIRGLVDVLKKYQLTPQLTAYTGRVAQRLRELCGTEASTIHALRSWDGEKFTKEEIKADFLIVDEASMVDLELLQELLVVVPSSCHVVLVGDVDQLPPIGAGAPFRDLILSEQIPLTRLMFNHRQNTNEIAKYANLVNEQQASVPSVCEAIEDLSVDRQFQFLSVEDPKKLQSAVLDVLTKFVQDKLHRHPIRDVQVLGTRSTAGKGFLSCPELSKYLQSELNPSSTTWNDYQVGDKVMCIKNNYGKGVWNGSSGIVESFGVGERETETDDTMAEPTGDSSDEITPRKKWST